MVINLGKKNTNFSYNRFTPSTRFQQYFSHITAFTLNVYFPRSTSVIYPDTDASVGMLSPQPWVPGREAINYLL